MRAEDLERVAAIEREAFTAPWKEETFRTLLGRPGAELLVLETDADGVIGYTVMWCIEDQGELANIGIAEGHRGGGLGNLLLDRTIALAVERGVRSLYLEVRESNERARKMYERRGFEEIGVRRAYYDDPREDARVLVKRL
ncbi:MAG: ribosomal protein S18-alanine N-acetyltransferase [Gemmatimonadetes bacterium]|nr:ribosomal protein S18-alanine N-acetyltransferase [Gemmatimonadota bacterium]